MALSSWPATADSGSVGNRAPSWSVTRRRSWRSSSIATPAQNGGAFFSALAAPFAIAAASGAFSSRANSARMRWPEEFFFTASLPPCFTWPVALSSKRVEFPSPAPSRRRRCDSAATPRCAWCRSSAPDRAARAWNPPHRRRLYGTRDRTPPRPLPNPHWRSGHPPPSNRSRCMA